MNNLVKFQERWRDSLVHWDMSDLDTEDLETELAQGQLWNGHELGRDVFQKLHRLQTVDLSAKWDDWRNENKFLSLGRLAFMQAAWLAPELRVLDWSGIHVLGAGVDLLMET
eukprot:5167759-Amphidinium_carterae.1